MLWLGHHKKIYAHVHWSLDLWFDSWQVQGVCLFSTASHLALGPTQTQIVWVIGAVNQQGCEADHSSPSNAEVQNEWSYAFMPQFTFMACTRRLNVFIVAVSSSFCRDNLPVYVTVQSLKLFFCMLLSRHINKTSYRSWRYQYRLYIILLRIFWWLSVFNIVLIIV